jgi:glycosyltransferase involved in cell wall biosynthesis
VTAQRQVEVVVPIFGGLDVWLPRARAAKASVDAQTVPTACHIVEGVDLADARNAALAFVETEFVILLDADDTLAPDYVEHMLAGTGDVRWPSVAYPDGTVVAEASNPLPEWNQVVIGAMARRDLLVRVGGFRDLPVLEDYDLWCRCWAAGADMQPCLDAVYRYHHTQRGRSATMQGVHDQWHRRIREQYSG